MSEAAVCPSCHSLLPPGRLAGLCPACAWASLMADDESAPVPTGGPALMRLAGYDLLEEIARGGMGIVYRARQIDPTREVALKMLLPHQTGVTVLAERFRLEARTLAELEHPAILPVYQAGEHDGMPFFTMKLATGGTLAQRRGALRGRWRDVAELIATVADAVQFAHEHGVLHRDLKPGNILFDECDRVFVGDFGLAKLVDTGADLTRSAEFLGTPHYVAPEVAARCAQAATTASDIYSLGAVLFELLAGRPPFEADGVPALLRKIEQESPVFEPSGGVPRDLAVICLKCLAKEPARRYGAARELAEDLRRWLGGRTILARPATAAERFTSWARRNPALAGALSVLAVVLGAAIVLQALGYRRTQAALAEALLAQSQALRHGGRAGQRVQALAAVQRAAAIRPDLRARNEAASALLAPDLQAPREVSTYYANAGSSFDFTPDLARYLVGTSNGFALHDASTGRALRSFATRNTSPGSQLQFSPDGAWAFVVCVDEHAELWRLDAAQAELVRPAARDLPAVGAFSAKALFYLATSGHLMRREMADGAEQQLPNPLRILDNLSASPDGSALLLLNAGELALLDLSWQRVRWQQRGNFGNATPAWSRDGELVAVADAGRNAIVLFDRGSGAVGRTLHGHTRLPRRLAFHPDGRSFVSVSDDFTLRVWDLASGTPLLEASAAPRGLKISSDGMRLAYAPGHLLCAVTELVTSRLWSEFAATAPGRVGDALTPMQVSGDRVLTVSGDEVRLWDTAKEAQLKSLQQPPGPLAALFTSDGRRILLGQRGGVAAQSEMASTSTSPLGTNALLVWSTHPRWWVVERGNGTVVLWPDGDGAREKALTTSARINGAAISPDGVYVALGTGPMPGVTVWDTAKAVKVASVPLKRHAQIAFSPDGRWLFTGTDDSYAALDTRSWRPSARWTAEPGTRSRGVIACSPDGRLVAVASGRKSVQVRAAPAFDELVTLELPGSHAIESLGWSQEGTRLLVQTPGHRLFALDLSALREELGTLGLGW